MSLISRPANKPTPPWVSLCTATLLRPALLINTVPRRAQQTQQTQEQGRVKEGKVGEVIPKTQHQATKEERLRMSCSHDEKKCRFSLRCDAAHPVVAVVDYEVLRPGVWDLKYTQVSPEFQHHGVADEVVIRALEFAQANDIKVITSCSYIGDTFMARHPEWQKLRADSEDSKQQNEQAKTDTKNLQYNERVKKDNGAPDLKFPKQKQGEPQQTQQKGGPDMKQEGSKSNAEKLVDTEPSARAARELNEAMKKNKTGRVGP